jgi:dUTPase
MNSITSEFVGDKFNRKFSVKRLSPSAVIPTRGSQFAAGYDISSSENVIVPARGQAMIKTGIAVAIPYGTYFRIAPRSGLASKFKIDVMAGVVDYVCILRCCKLELNVLCFLMLMKRVLNICLLQDYRGEVRVILINHGDENFGVKEGDRIAQGILEQIVLQTIEEVEELPETDRGTNGFGSTGR